jgi:hypothetical protein
MTTIAMGKKTMEENSRREFLKRVAYVAPAVISLAAMPAIANTGSPDVPNIKENCNNGLGNGSDCPPPGLPRNNDQPGEAIPGQPQTQDNR